jgi:uncharacterized protein YecE (DUF72 family)
MRVAMSRSGSSAKAGRVRAGMGGWTYEPWRQTFYPGDLPRARELHYASRQVTAIEVNGTFYRTQSPSTFAKWRDETPADFAFTLKAPRYTTHRTVLAESGAGIERFLDSGIAELGPKLGAILWSFPATKKFEPHDFERFLALLPATRHGLRLRHAIDVRHETFMTGEFVALARRSGVGIVFTDAPDVPACADLTADFVYARLKRTLASEEAGYPRAALRDWARRARTWAEGGEPDDLPRLDRSHAVREPRDAFVFFIAGAKERAPLAARALVSELE